MFFEHHGRQSSMTGTNPMQSGARRGLAAIALAVGLVGAMALPLRGADNTAIGSAATDNTAASPTTAPTAVASAAPTTGDAAADQQPQSVARLIAEVQAEKLDDTQLMERGVAELNNKNYEEALALFQQINTDNKDQAYKDSLARVMNDAQHGADERKAARASFEKGQQDLQAGNNSDAVAQFNDAINNKYADPGTVEKAKEQLAVAQAAPANPAAGQPAAAAKPTDQRSTYFAAKAAYRRGDLADAKTQFESLQAAGYKAPLFERSVGDYLKDIDSKMAAKGAETPAAPTAQATGNAPAENPAAPTTAPATPAPEAAAPQTPAAPAAPEANNNGNNAVAAAPTTEPAETPQAAPQMTRAQIKQAYETGRQQYRKGDWINARKNLQIAADANYDPGLFNDKPGKILARMDAKEQADAAQAARDAARRQAEEANATGGSTALAVPPTTAPTAEANATTQPVAPEAGNAPPSGNNEVAVAPVTAPANGTGNELQTTAELNKVTTEKNAFEARQLVQQADTLRTNGDNEGALEKYSLAAEKDPTNAQAVKGKNELMELTGRSTAGISQLDRVQAEIETRRQAITYSFDTAIADANAAISANNYDDAQRAVERAKVARNQDPQIFTPAEINHFDSTIATTQLHVDNARSAYEQQQARTNTQTAQAEAKRRLQEEEQNRRATVAGLIKQSMQLTHDGKYEESLGVIDQILTIDPQNEYALGTRPLVEDKALLQEQRRYKEDFDRQLTKTWNLADEQRIPYNDIIRYPDNWPGLSETRDRTVADEQGGDKEDLAVEQQLDKVLSMEVPIDNSAFVDVVKWMHEITQANINVKWATLEAAGIDKSAMVNINPPLRNVTFRKILRTVLDDVGGGTVKLDYTVDEGVIEISTADDLKSKGGLLRIYDVRDLLFQPPDYTDAPDFNITSNNTQTSGSGGGGGGGGGSQNLFNGSNTGQTSTQNQPTYQDQVDDLKKKIEELVDSSSWLENGGTGTVDEFPQKSGQFLVNQTPDNQRQIAAILEQLRANRAIQITIETRFLKVQRNFLEDIGLNFDFQFNNPGGNPNGGNLNGAAPIIFNQNSSAFTQSSNLDTTLPGNLATLLPGAALSTSLTYINDFQVSALIRATQATQSSTTITAPRITLYDGQLSWMVVSTTQAYVSNLTPIVGSNAVGFSPTISTVGSGVVLSVRAWVSADRKYVTMDLTPELSNLLALVPFVISGSEVIPSGNNASTQPFANQGVVQQPEVQITEVKTTATVPDGGTLLLGGQTLSGDIEREMGVPILSKIPFLKRLFTNRSYAKDDQVLLILVKPTIIIEREQEEKQFPLLTSKTGG